MSCDGELASCKTFRSLLSTYRPNLQKRLHPIVQALFNLPLRLRSVDFAPRANSSKLALSINERLLINVTRSPLQLRDHI